MKFNLRKIMFLFLLVFVMGISKVEATTITVDQVIEGMQNTELWENIYDWYDGTVTLSKDVDNNSVYANANSEELLIFQYTDDYVYIDKREVESGLTDLFFMPDLFFMADLIYGTFIAYGYTEEQVNNVMSHLDYDLNLSYDEYGMELVLEEEEGSEEENYLWYLRISLDSTNIDKLVSEYGSTYYDDGTIVNVNLVPTLTVKEVTSNSVSIYYEIEDYDSTKPVFCQVYRSTSRDGEYEELSFQPNCTGGLTVTDDDLESNTTYYYKARLVGGTKYSEVVSFKTLATSQDEIIDTNPDTGLSIIFSAIFMLVISVGIFTYFYKKVTS